MGSKAAFHPDLETSHADMIVRKGSNPEVDSYSAFFENDHKHHRPAWLSSFPGTEIDLAGLATDYCAAYSALDSAAWL